MGMHRLKMRLRKSKQTLPQKKKQKILKKMKITLDKGRSLC